MNQIIKNVLLGIFFLYSVSLNAENLDVSKFDIAGVKLGMNPDQAIEKIVETYGIDKKELSIRKRYSEGEEYISKITYNSKKMSIYIDFCRTREGKDNSPLVVVDGISYVVSATVENEKNMSKAALSKYGEPTKKLSETRLYWCTEVEKAPLYCSLMKPYLRLDGVVLKLADGGYAKRLSEYLRKQKIVKPKF